MVKPSKLLIHPELFTRDGRVIRTFADAIAFVRDHEARPGVDTRDEVLHRLERAQTEQEREEAATAFLTWAKELDLVLATSDASRQQA